MSVRKTASVGGAGSSGSVIGVHVVKTLGFWIALAIASFIVGLFILSPLINVASGSHNVPAMTASSLGHTQPPRPASNSAAGPRTESRRERSTDSDVAITPGRDANQDVQSPAPVDDAGTARTNDY